MESAIAFVKEQIASCNRQMTAEPDKSEMFLRIIDIFERDLAILNARAAFAASRLPNGIDHLLLKAG